MSTDRVLAITERIIRQILRDRRSIGLLIVGPLIVMSLVGFSLYEQRAVLDRVAPGLLAVFVMFFTFILTGVGFLRERAQGTLERLQTTLVGSFDIMLGYMIGFLIFAIVQTAVILAFTIFALRIEYVGTLWEIGAILFLVVTVAVSLGIFTLISSRAVDFSVGLLQVFDVSDALLVFVLGWDYMSRTFGKLDQCWDVAFSVLDYV